MSLSVPSSLHALKVGRRDCRVPFDDSSSSQARSPVGPGPVQRYSVLCVNLPCRSHLTVLTLTYEPRPFLFFPLASFHQPGFALDLMYLTFRKQGICNRLASDISCRSSEAWLRLFSQWTLSLRIARWPWPLAMGQPTDLVL